MIASSRAQKLHFVYFVPSTGIEPVLLDPQSSVLSIKLRGHFTTLLYHSPPRIQSLCPLRVVVFRNAGKSNSWVCLSLIAFTIEFLAFSKANFSPLSYLYPIVMGLTILSIIYFAIMAVMRSPHSILRWCLLMLTVVASGFVVFIGYILKSAVDAGL